MLLVARSVSIQAQVPYERILRSGQEPQNWLTYSGNYNGQRNNTLAQITPENVKNLELRWIFQARSREKFEARLAQRRMKFDVEVKRVIHWANRRVMKRHHIRKRHTPQVVVPDEQNLQQFAFVETAAAIHNQALKPIRIFMELLVLDSYFME